MEKRLSRQDLELLDLSTTLMAEGLGDLAMKGLKAYGSLLSKSFKDGYARGSSFGSKVSGAPKGSPIDIQALRRSSRRRLPGGRLPRFRQPPGSPQEAGVQLGQVLSLMSQQLSAVLGVSRQDALKALTRLAMKSQAGRR